MFMPEEMGPLRCMSCSKPAAWRVYNRKVKLEQEFCKGHVPPEGTPRIRNYRKIQKHWCWLEELRDNEATN